MNRLWWRASLWGLALFLGAAGTLSLRAGGGSRTEDGYVSLFNGKDLAGWVYPGQKGKPMDGKTETPDGRFEVRDGVIVVKEKDAKGKGGIRDLYTARIFDKDFHLKLEFRAAPRADSGVYVRGPQLQVRDYPTVGPYKKLKTFKNADWNELDIIVRGGIVTTTVNGKAVSPKDVLEVTVKDGKPEARLNGKGVEVSKIEVSVGAAAECRCNGELLEKAMKVPSKGGIGLQAESGKFEFRRIRVKQMP